MCLLCLGSYQALNAFWRGVNLKILNIFYINNQKEMGKRKQHKNDLTFSS